MTTPRQSLWAVAPEDRPRERLARLGPAGLSEAELVALVLGSGMPGINVLDSARSLLAQAGGVTELMTMTVGELKSLMGVGVATAGRVVAVAELWRRANDPPPGPVLETPQHIVDAVRAHLAARAHPPAFAPPPADVPRTAEPSVDVPRNVGPRTDAPGVKSPPTDASRVEARQTDAPRVEEPPTGAPRVGAPPTDASRVEARQTDALGVESPPTDAPRAVVPRTDAPPVDVPRPHTPVVAASPVAVPATVARGGARVAEDYGTPDGAPPGGGSMFVVVADGELRLRVVVPLPDAQSLVASVLHEVLYRGGSAFALAVCSAEHPQTDDDLRATRDVLKLAAATVGLRYLSTVIVTDSSWCTLD